MFLVSCIQITMAGCNKERVFDFGVYNNTGTQLPSAAVAFPNEPPVRVGTVGLDGIKVMAGLRGPVPDSADVLWTDQANVAHKRHVQIKPLPPPTVSSYDGEARSIYFQIDPDGSVKMVYHFPKFKE